MGLNPVLVHFSDSKTLTQPVTPYAMYVGACGLVDQASSSRSKGLKLDSHFRSCVEVNFSFHITSAYPAVMGTWWNYKN